MYYCVYVGSQHAYDVDPSADYFDQINFVVGFSLNAGSEWAVDIDMTQVNWF